MKRGLHIGQLMTRTPVVCNPDDPLLDARDRMAARKIHHLPVVAGEQVVGLLSASDIDTLHRCPYTSLSSATVADAMTPAPYVVSIFTPVDEVVRAMVAHRFGSAVVVDHRQRVRGIFTTADALRFFAALVHARDQRLADS